MRSAAGDGGSPNRWEFFPGARGGLGEITQIPAGGNWSLMRFGPVSRAICACGSTGTALAQGDAVNLSLISNKKRYGYAKYLLVLFTNLHFGRTGFGGAQGAGG